MQDFINDKNRTMAFLALQDYPYFVLRNEMKIGYNDYQKELIEIKKNYIDYKIGADFYTEGSAGDYVPSAIHFKTIKTLIDRESRFMFSQTPDIVLQQIGTEEAQKKQIEQYQKLVNKVLENSHFSSNLLKISKDCFIGKRVACLVDYSEKYGIQLHFYNSLQFYYETDGNTENITKFICFESLNKNGSNSDRKYLVTKYEDEEDTVFVSSIVYDGAGKEVEVQIERTAIALDYIPIVVITNDGTIEDRRGVSEIDDLSEFESGYSRLANGDIDSERKGMNPIRYTVDMNSETTKNLSSGAGAYWDLRSEQNQNEVHPSVGTLAPQMNHSEAVNTTLNRIRSAMHNSVDVPDISKDGLLSGITSFKALKALYYPLSVRCDEKLKTWKPAIKRIVEIIIEFAILNKQQVISMYVLTGLEEVQYNIEVSENYALLDDENEEKEMDLNEIAHNARSRKSYIKKWRESEFKSDEQIDNELMQIAIENNMFDSMSMNTQVQTEIQNRTEQTTTEQIIEEQTEQQEI